MFGGRQGILISISSDIIYGKAARASQVRNIYSRVKDIFDLSYLAEFVDCDTLAEYIREYILEDPEMLENDMDAVRNRVDRIFNDREFIRNIENSRRDNWLNIQPETAFSIIRELLKGLGH
jgi:hypothetical protein